MNIIRSERDELQLSEQASEKGVDNIEEDNNILTCVWVCVWVE